MGNNKGQHDPMKFVKEIFKVYYGITSDYDKILLDFDDTIWARNYKSSEIDRKVSIDNLEMLNKMANKILIVSGNTYLSISKKLFEVFGTNLEDCELNIWADVNSRNYYKNEVKSTIEDFVLPLDKVDTVTNILNTLGIAYTFDNEKSVINIKVKSLSDLERTLLCAYLNESVFSREALSNFVAKKTGKATVDIVAKTNTKRAVFDYLNLSKENTLYIGDEIDSGNDRDIAYACNNFVNVVNVNETNFILKLIGDFI
mgnify:FL=1